MAKSTIFKVLIVTLLAFVFCHKSYSQNQKTPEQLAAEQRLPEGAKMPDYFIRKPEGGKVAHPKIEPSSWWIGMQNPMLEILIYDENVKGGTVQLKHKGVKVVKTENAESPNYLFVTLEIKPNAEAGSVPISVIHNGKARTYILKLQNRQPNRKYAQGLTPADFTYLLMPDRFSNGDPKNDSYNDMTQRGIDRSKMYFRHGGDLQGVINHLDYLQELGVTTLWCNPVFENNEPFESYHGYAITDHYNVDKRLGDNELFKSLVDKLHERGMKCMKDIIFNHIGDQHYFMKDIPSSDWIHQWDNFTKTNHRYQTLFDPYASQKDKKEELDGWFIEHMADLNQENPHVAKYLIQNCIWWVEYAGIDAFRVDTWPYSNPKFLDDWSAAIFKEYPNMYVCIESWVDGNNNQAHFVKKPFKTSTGKDKYLAPIDFQFSTAILEALNRNEEWTGGVNRIFHTLSNDFLYPEPCMNLTFLDNHDMSRAYSTFGENKEKLRSSLAFLLTSRGTPQLYYGTEILMAGISNPDGYVRFDFPGGWAGDKSNKFTAAGRTDDENAMFNYTKKLANYRKSSTALTTGKMTQFIPKEGVYTYCRYDDKSTVMVIMNAKDKAMDKLDISRFSECTKGAIKGKNIITDEVIDLNTITLAPHQTIMIELMK